MVKGREYLYIAQYDEGKKTEIYYGLATSPESQKKAIKLEIKYVKEKKEELSKTINHLRDKLKKYRGRS